MSSETTPTVGQGPPHDSLQRHLRASHPHHTLPTTSGGGPVFEEYYSTKELWPAESLERRRRMIEKARER